MSAAVTYERILLLEAHLAVIAVIRTLLGVCALVLAQVGRPLEALATRGAAEWPRALWLTLVVQKLRRFLKVQLAHIALEQVLARVCVHVPHQV